MRYNFPKYIFKLVIFMLLFGTSKNITAQLKANFSAIPTSGCTPLVVSFSDASTGNPTSWKWDFGNGTSLLQNPTATYFIPGQYTIKLTVKNASGADSLTKVQYITVNASPTPQFSGTPQTNCSAPLSVQFTDQSAAGSGSITLWEWDFGDGFLSSAQNPQHNYTNTGTYNVSLRITNSLGCFKTLTKSNYINLSSLKADFSNSSPSTCSAPATINFQNLSSGSGTLNYQWFFGDGGTSTALNPSYTYTAPGSYTVKLITTNSLGCSDTLTKSVIVGNGKANFSIPANICRGDSLKITNTSAPAPSSVFWDFGDGTFSTLLNPPKVYNSTGIYSVKLISYFGTCADSITKMITVLAAPIPTFIADVLSSCKTPQQVNFTSNVPGALSYLWNFGDGSTSTAANPSHTYLTNGNFDVSLSVTNAGGCTQILYKPGYIKIQPLNITIPGLPDEGCAPFTRSFTANIFPQDSIVNYLWNFGDGTPASVLSNPSHTFINPGSYTITLTVNTVKGCSATATYIDSIQTGVRPVPNFIADPRNICADTLIRFTDLSTGNIDKWLWKFGDGGTSAIKNPEYKYKDTGIFSVTLIVWDRGCSNSIEFTDYIRISPPIAIFADTFNCSAPNQRQFLDSSIGADTWHWDFGDGDTSNLQNPVHTYTAAGTYIVSLTVTNFKTGCSFTRKNPVTILNLKSDFIADTAICTGSSAKFQVLNIDTSQVLSYSWDFGDGNTVTEFAGNVQHTYPVSGKYTIKLITTNAYGCADTTTKPSYIFVRNPKAGFSSNTNACLNNSKIIFNDTTVNDGVHPITQWIWNYGDAISDTLNSPPFQHTYTSEGVFSISLKVKDSNGCIDSTQKINYITITSSKANFTSPDTLSCPGKPINFMNTSAGRNLTYLWNFGDGSTSTEANPAHPFANAGIYTIKLIVKDLYGCTDSLVRQSYITIRALKADFTLSDTLSTCPPLVVKFTNKSTNYKSFTWDFGDGTTSKIDTPTHFYSSRGIFNVKLTAIGEGGCIDVKTRTIIVRGPQGTLSYSDLRGCIPYQTRFTVATNDKLSFIWDFNDGTTIKTTDTTITHTYINADSYLPKIILADPNGCQVAVTGADSIHALDVTAGYNTDRFMLCDSGFVNFNNSTISNDTIASYLWTFGDGDSSIIKNPIHYYKASGIYNTSLSVITKAGCTDTIKASVPIKIIQSPDIKIAGDSSACVPATITFSGQILKPDTSAVTWKWEFGNSQTSTLQNPAPQSYPVVGTFKVQAIATNSSGCKDTSTKILQVNPLPILKTTADTVICKGNPITLNVSGAATYTWSPVIGLSCIDCANPVALPDSNIKYTVTGISSFGCIAKDSISLTVKFPFKINVSPPDTLCIGRGVKLFATGTDIYTWSPQTGLSNPNISNPMAAPRQTTTYTVVGSDNAGCFKDTAIVNIKVYPYPTIDAGKDTTIILGQSIRITPVISSDVTNITWLPPSGIASYQFPGIIARPYANTEYTAEASNSGKCKASDRVTVFVICNNMNVFIPNTFSPNDDGVNDIFYIRGSGIFKIKTLRIFNRLGEVVFESSNKYPNDASAGWNGTYKGQRLISDVYVYMAEVLCENNSLLSYKGNITLIK